MKRTTIGWVAVWVMAAGLQARGEEGDPSAPMIKVDPRGRPNPFLVPYDKPQLLITESGLELPPPPSPASPAETSKPAPAKPHETPRAPDKPPPSTAPRILTAAEAKARLEEFEAAVKRLEEALSRNEDPSQISSAGSHLAAQISGLPWPKDDRETSEHRDELLGRLRNLQQRAGARVQFRQRAWTLQFIAYREDQPRRSVACIDGRIIHVGEPVEGGVTLKAIRPDGVVLYFDGDELKLPLRK